MDISELFFMWDYRFLCDIEYLLIRVDEEDIEKLNDWKEAFYFKEMFKKLKGIYFWSKKYKNTFQISNFSEYESLYWKRTIEFLKIQKIQVFKNKKEFEKKLNIFTQNISWVFTFNDFGVEPIPVDFGC